MEPTYITGGGKERLPSAIALQGEVFKTDPVIRFFLHHMAPGAQSAYVPQFLGTLFKVAGANGGVFDEAWTTSGGRPAHDAAAPPACSCVWMPPGRKVGELGDYVSLDFLRVAYRLGFRGLRRLLSEWVTTAEAAKKKALGEKLKRHYYIFFVATAVEERGKGLASELIRRVQEKAAKDGKPMWLEATTEKSRRLYLRLGFTDVHSWVLGKGVVNSDGVEEKGGEGVRVWAMVWWPDGEGSREEDRS